MNRRLAEYLLYWPATLLRGERVGKYLREYQTSEWNTAVELRDSQESALKRLIQHAYERTTYYRKLFDEAGIKPNDINQIRDLAVLPVLTKTALRDCYQSLTATPRARFATKKTTGGSTGQAVTVLKNPNALARERAATWRAYQWAGIHVGSPQARFWGVPLRKQDQIIQILTDFVTNRRRLSAFGITDARMAEYYDALKQFRPTYFYGYVSVLLEFADYLDSRGLSIDWSLTSVITTAEVLGDDTRTRLENVFGCPVFNEYGCGEVGSIAHECESGSMHVMDENLIVEFVSNPESPQMTELVVTDLYNFAMPLIRYRIGDFATRESQDCPCGRKLTRIKGIHGRAYDILVDKKGRKHHPELIMYVFEDMKRRNSSVRQFQVIQKSAGTLLVYLVVDNENSPDRSVEEELAKSIENAIGTQIDIKFEYKHRIPREPSGKLRLVKSEISPAIRQ